MSSVSDRVQDFLIKVTGGGQEERFASQDKRLADWQARRAKSLDARQDDRSLLARSAEGPQDLRQQDRFAREQQWLDDRQARLAKNPADQ
jgi:hypothetical protein